MNQQSSWRICLGGELQLLRYDFCRHRGWKGVTVAIFVASCSIYTVVMRIISEPLFVPLNFSLPWRNVHFWDSYHREIRGFAAAGGHLRKKTKGLAMEQAVSTTSTCFDNDTLLDPAGRFLLLWSNAAPGSDRCQNFRKWPRFAARVLVGVKFNCKRPSGRSFLSTFLSTSNGGLANQTFMIHDCPDIHYVINEEISMVNMVPSSS